MRIVLSAMIASSLLAASCAHSVERPNVAAGHELAVRHCSECHAVDGAGPGPLADAPPFRDLPQRFPVDRFTRAYRDGMFEGHPRMPPVKLDPDELTELSAFLATLPKQAPETAAHR